MKDITYVIYSHTDYLDVLSVQTEYLKNHSNKILLINKSELDLSSVYSKYKKVIFYDDTLPYASRLLSLSELTEEYILLLHDIDIIVKKDDDVINHLKSYMSSNKIDRIDLQCRHEWDKSNKNIIYAEIKNLKIELREQKNVNNYIYNVNPSIWKLNVLLDIMTKYKMESYRSIENLSVMNYCLKYKIYKLYSENFINCGWFSCLPFFQFIHITHKGKLLPKTNNRLDKHLKSDYDKIIEKLLKVNTNKIFYEGNIH